MDPIEWIAALIAIPAVRTEIETLVVKIVAEIFHRRQVDPAFLDKSDTVFALWGSARTEDDKNAAQVALRDLMSQ